MQTPHPAFAGNDLCLYRAAGGLIKEFGVFDLPFLFDNEKVPMRCWTGPKVGNCWTSA